MLKTKQKRRRRRRRRRGPHKSPNERQCYICESKAWVSFNILFWNGLNREKLLLYIQVASLQAELAMVQTQLINSRFAFANSLQNSQQQQQRQNIAVLQPAYSNNSSASNNLISMSAFTSNFDIVAETAPSPHSLEPLQLSRPSQDEEEDEEESHIPHVFGNEILHRSWLPQLSFCLLELLALTHTYSCAITCFYDNAMLANWCILELSTVSLGKAQKKKKKKKNYTLHNLHYVC